MNIKRKTLMQVMGFVILAGLGLQECSVTSRGKINGIAKSDTTRSISPYFTPATTEARAAAGPVCGSKKLSIRL